MTDVAQQQSRLKDLIGKGKEQRDKRDDIKKRDTDREMKRAAMHHRKGK